MVRTLVWSLKKNKKKKGLKAVAGCGMSAPIIAPHSTSEERLLWNGICLWCGIAQTKKMRVTCSTCEAKYDGTITQEKWKELHPTTSVSCF